MDPRTIVHRVETKEEMEGWKEIQYSMAEIQQIDAQFSYMIATLTKTVTKCEVSVHPVR